MRELVDAERVTRFMRGLGRAASNETVCYLAGEEIRPALYRFPAVGEPSFARAVESIS
jgi:hypothetical protein